ncbi:Pentatricopeptide repeat-containing protein [Acorus gramineus]|uniref:Pentatricopeptide repeat-containing protein n=1 Tax=Acorus gramineus TaxID=55184 RepID=A0AAV9A7H5_ACOGR|nr:Pentatricopeptide repeat-containing protein [Acorus gramineus]
MISSKLLFSKNLWKSRHESAITSHCSILLRSMFNANLSSAPNRTTSGDRRGFDRDSRETMRGRRGSFFDDDDGGFEDEKPNRMRRGPPERIPSRPIRGRRGPLSKGPSFDDEEGDFDEEKSKRVPNRRPFGGEGRQGRSKDPFFDDGEGQTPSRFRGDRRPERVQSGSMRGWNSPDRPDPRRRGRPKSPFTGRFKLGEDEDEKGGLPDELIGERKKGWFKNSIMDDLKFDEDDEDDEKIEKTHEDSETQLSDRVEVDEKVDQPKFSIFNESNEMGETDKAEKAEEDSDSSPQDADEIFKKMKETGLIPNAVAMLDGLCKDGLVQEAMKLFGLMREKGTIPEVVIYTAVVEGFCKAAKYEDVKRIFKKMQDKGIQPNAFSYGVIIRGLVKGKQLEDSVEFCLEMLEAGHYPNAATFVCLVDGVCKEKGVEEAEGVLSRLRDKGFAVDERAVREHLDKKGTFDRSIWDVIFGKRLPERPRLPKRPL